MSQAFETSQIPYIARICCENAGIELPDSFDTDFSTNLQGIKPIKSFQGINTVCTHVRSTLASSEDLEWNYGDTVAVISTPIRLCIAHTLGFEEYVLRIDPGTRISNRDFLHSFLLSLEEGEEWSVEKLKKWQCNQTTGAQYYYRLRQICGWNLDVVKAILGKDANALLERNPCTTSFKPFVLTSPVIARKYLVKYLQSLADGEKWSCDTLRLWESSNGVNGNALYYWLLRNLKGVVNKDTIRAFLGERFAVHLDTHPYDALEKKLRNKNDVKKYLLEFLESLPDGTTWNSRSLDAWISADGFRGINIRFWVANNVDGGFSEQNIKGILEEKADKILSEHPIDIQKREILSTEDAKKYLLEFLGTLKEGENWTPIRLRRWQSADGISGENIYRWIQKNTTDGFSKTSLRLVLKDKVEILDMHSLEKKEDIVTTLDYVTQYLIEFLEKLGDSKKWSARHLRQWTNSDGVSGENVYNWIARHIKNSAGEIDWIFILIKIIPEKYLTRNPFVYEKKLFFPSTQHFDTLAVDIDTLNLGRGIPDPLSRTPESILIAAEQLQRTQEKLDLLDKTVRTMTEEDQRVIKRFLDEEEVPKEELLPVFERIKKNIFRTA